MGIFKAPLLVLATAILVMLLPKLFKVKLPKKGHGFAAPGWRKVADVFKNLVETGAEEGGAFALYHNGELVVEFYGGYADHDAKVPYEKDTLVAACSSTKAVAAITVAVLVDRGLLDYSHPVREYWPEFAQNDKAHITLEVLLSHQAGLAAIDKPYSAYSILDDPEKVGKILAEQPPNWTPGEGHGYHGITIGLYMDQLVRRVDPQHRSLAQFFQEEIARPMGIDFYIGLPKEEVYRSSRSVGFSLLSTDLLFGKRYWPVVWEFLSNPQSLIYRSSTNPAEYAEDLENNPSWRELPNPSSHGFGTAAGTAKLMGIVANGGAHEGHTLLSESAIQALNEPLTTGVDKVLLMNVTYGRGVMLRPTPLGGLMLGAPGAGGQMAFADPGRALGWTYLTSAWSLYAIGDDPRYLALERAMYECVREVQQTTAGAGAGPAAGVDDKEQQQQQQQQQEDKKKET